MVEEISITPCQTVSGSCWKALYLIIMVSPLLCVPVSACAVSTTVDLLLSHWLQGKLVVPDYRLSTTSIDILTNKTLTSDEADIPGLLHCPRKGRRGKRKHIQPGTDTEEQAESSLETEEQEESRTVADWCLDFFADADIDGSHTINNEDWLEGALVGLYDALFESFDTHKAVGITGSFLIGLTGCTFSQISDVRKMLESREGEGEGEEIYTWLSAKKETENILDFLSYVQEWYSHGRLDNRSEQDSIDLAMSSFECSQFEVVTPRRRTKNGRVNKFHFVLKKLVKGEGDIRLRINGLLELLCLTLEPDIERTSAKYLLRMLKDMNILKLNNSVYSANKDLLPDRLKDATVPCIRPDVLIREMQGYFQETEFRPVIAEALLQVELPKSKSTRKKVNHFPTQDSLSQPSASVPSTLPSPTSVQDSTSSAVRSDFVSPSMQAGKRKTFSGRRNSQSVTPGYSATYAVPFPVPSSEPSPDLDPAVQLRRAIEVRDDEQAKKIYQDNKQVLEGKKNWRKLKSSLHQLLNESPQKYGGFIGKHRLNN